MMKWIIFDRDAWSEVYAAIRKNKMRTILTMIGVAWGMFLFVALLGASRGIQNGFDKIFANAATNSLFVWMEQTSIPFEGYQRGRTLELKMEDIEAIKGKFHQIKMIAPRSQQPSQTVSYGVKHNSYLIGGDYPAQNEMFKKPVIQGRFINDDDIKYSKKVCVISKEIQDELFSPKVNPIGKGLKIGSGVYTIVGIYKTGSISFGPRNEIHIPFTTFQRVYNRQGVVNYVIINAKDNVDIVDFEKQIKTFLKERKRVHPDDTQAIGGFNLGENMAKMFSFMSGLQLLAIVVGALTLFSGVIAIASILLITVSERTKEFGIRRALGAVPNQIRSQILLESIILTLIAGLSGIVGATLLLFGINTMVAAGGEDQFPFINASVDVTTLGVALLIMIIMAMIAGLIPAQRAIAIKPIDALRDE
ncbi:ABC transporter permease [Moheibacter sediminis]|uniref:Putative ABC transport system permease protein n=1 Tax=Moheibacter sediminis TaxID=1434700 RepID=A0A1W1Z4M2_9FLAO|nr:ABC transporter permease [Moheibacter sediminis]SMC43316.1 putative ABC transport system permease protein [Moheibacter sediminis]